ncbi:RWD domain-containing protein 1 [Savitreella phatthalungensis]
MSEEVVNEEEEVLQSIYPEELERINKNTFRIRLDIDPSETQYPRPPTIYLRTTLPAGYPDVAPELHLEVTASDEDDGADAPDVRDADTRPLAKDGFTRLYPNEVAALEVAAEDREAVLRQLRLTAEENLGLQMVFTLATTCREIFVGLLDDKWGSIEAARQRQEQEEEERKARRAEMTPLTKEYFLNWRRDFLNKQGLSKPAAVGEVKLTGRQMLEGDKTLGDMDDDEGDEVFDLSAFRQDIEATGE